MSNVRQFPVQTIDEWIVGPFTHHRVVLEGRCIPRLNAFREGEGDVTLVLDERFALTLPEERAHAAASMIANALAIGAGYPWFGAETKERPFAPRVGHITLPGSDPD